MKPSIYNAIKHIYYSFLGVTKLVLYTFLKRLKARSKELNTWASEKCCNQNFRFFSMLLVSIQFTSDLNSPRSPYLQLTSSSDKEAVRMFQETFQGLRLIGIKSKVWIFQFVLFLIDHPSVILYEFLDSYQYHID